MVPDPCFLAEMKRTHFPDQRLCVCVYLSPRLSDDLALGGFTAAGRDLSQSGQSTIPQDPSASHWEWLINQEVIQ